MNMNTVGINQDIAQNGQGVDMASARIIIDIAADGACHLRSEFMGRVDACYATVPDERLLAVEIPKLLAELRAQLASSSELTE